MVSCQVDDVNMKFSKLDDLEKNGWVIQEVVPRKKPVKVWHTFFCVLACGSNIVHS